MTHRRVVPSHPRPSHFCVLDFVCPGAPVFCRTLLVKRQGTAGGSGRSHQAIRAVPGVPVVALQPEDATHRIARRGEQSARPALVVAQVRSGNGRPGVGRPVAGGRVASAQALALRAHGACILFSIQIKALPLSSCALKYLPSISAVVPTHSISLRFAAFLRETPCYIDSTRHRLRPTGPAGRAVLAKFLPVLRTCHAAVPFSSSERYAVMGKLHAMLLHFGVPSVFYTVAPNDVDNVLTLQLSLGRDNVRLPLPDVSTRFSSLAANPVAAAHIFERQVGVFMSVLLGMPAADATKKTQPVLGRQKGIFGIIPLLRCQPQSSGPSNRSAKRDIVVATPLSPRGSTVVANQLPSPRFPIPVRIAIFRPRKDKGMFTTPVAHCTCYETQGRGSLHFHGLLWGGVPPKVLDFIRTDPALVRTAARTLDSQLCAALSADRHAEWEARVRSGTPAPRMLELKSLPGRPSGTPSDPKWLTSLSVRPPRELFNWQISRPVLTVPDMAFCRTAMVGSGVGGGDGTFKGGQLTLGVCGPVRSVVLPFRK